MRAEDQLKADEEEEADEIIQGLVEGRDDESAEERAVEDLPHATRRYNDVVVTMRALFEGREVDLEQFASLSRDDRDALAVLQQAVSGRGRRGRFIYAEDRLERLNQVLSVLQPVLSVAGAPGVDGLRDDLASVIDAVDDLRDRLGKLEGAQEEYMFQEPGSELAADEDEEPPPEVPPLDAPPRPSTLAAGPAVAARPPGPTTLTGSPEVPDRTAPPSTLSTGPAVADRAARPSSLTGAPAAPDLSDRPSTLSAGPEVPDLSSPPSTLSEPEAEPAVATSTPPRRRGR